MYKIQYSIFNKTIINVLVYKGGSMKESMYDRYGGFGTVSKIVHKLYEKMSASETLQAFFENVDMQRLMSHQTQFFSYIMGGPFIYDNAQLAKVHRNLGITHETFVEVEELLEEVLEDFNVNQNDIDTLLAMVKGLESQIVSQT